MPKNQKIAAGKGMDFNRSIINTAIGKNNLTSGITRWEIQDDTAGVGNINEKGEVFPLNKGSFSIRAICFQSKQKYELWQKDKLVNKKNITAASKWYTVKVDDSNGNAIVETQVEMDKAIASDEFNQVTLSTEKEVTFIINQGNYPNKTIIVNAPNADINNFALFKNIVIQAIKENTWNENAKGNIIKVNSVKIRIVVKKLAEVKELILENPNTILNLEVEGIIHKITILKPLILNLTGNGNKLPITLEKTAEGSIITTSNPINVEESGNSDFIFNIGSEGSTINKSDKAIVIMVQNNSRQSVIITTNYIGEEIIKAGESGLSDEKSQQPSTPASSYTGYPGTFPTATPISTTNINGNAVVGVTLTATILPLNSTVMYQWLIANTENGSYVKIPGAVLHTYKLSAADSGKYIKVSASGIGSYTGIVTSNPTEKVAPSIITTTMVTGVTAPVRDTSPVVKISNADQFTGTVNWSPVVVNNKFADSTVYTATITLEPKEGYTLTGVPVNYFTVAGSNLVSNLVNSGIINVVFPATDPAPDFSLADVTSSTATPTQYSLFNLDVSGAKGINGVNLTGDIDVSVTSSNITEGTTGVVYHETLSFTGGSATVPITLTKTGMQTLTVKITGVTAVKTANVIVNIDTKGAYITALKYVDTTHLKVIFDEILDEYTAQTVVNYTFDGTFGLTGHPIQAIYGGVNKNEVLLIVSNISSIVDGQSINVTVSNVEDLAGNTVDLLHNVGEFHADFTGENVIDLEYVDATHIKVSFNEPIDAITAQEVTNYRLGGTFGLTGNPSKAVLDGADSSKVTLTVSNMSSIIDGDTVSIVVENVKDLAGNSINLAQNSAQFIVDTTGAFVTNLAYVDTTHIKLTFNEPLDMTTAQNIANYALGGTFGLIGNPIQAELSGAGNNVVTLTVSDMSSITNGYTVLVTVANVEDLAGNVVDHPHNKGQFSVDYTGAYVNYIEYVDTTHIKVVFDEPLDVITSQNVLNYTLGGTFGLTGHPIQALLDGANNSEVTLTVSDMSSITDGQSIKITVLNVEDLSNNPVDSSNNVGEIFADYSGAYLINVNYVDDTHIIAIFDEPIDQTIAQDVTNYTLGGTFGLTGHPIQAILGGADNNEVILTVNDMSLINNGQTVSVTAVNIEDLAGNLVDPAHNTAQFTISNKNIYVIKLEYIDVTHIKVTFDETLDEGTAQNVANYTLSGTFGLTGHPNQAVLGGAGNKEVTLTVNDMSSITDNQTVSVIVTNVEDLAGNQVDAAYDDAQFTIDNSGAYVSNLFYVDATHIKVVFNEIINAMTAQNIENYTLNGTFGMIGHPIQAVLGGVGSTEVTLTVDDMSSITDNQTVSVTVTNVEDLAGNQVDAAHNSAQFKIDNVGAYVSYISYVDTTHIKIVFNEALDVATAQDVDNYTLGNTLIGNPNNAVLGGTNSNEVILTINAITTVSDGETILVTVANVEDLAGNSVDPSHNSAQYMVDNIGTYVTDLVYVDANHIKVIFDESLDVATAQNILNYTLGGTGGLTGNPSQAVLGGLDNMEVTLTVGDMSSIIPGQTVSITVINVEDLCDNPVDTGNSIAQFTIN